jgi:hypothetical protein
VPSLRGFVAAVEGHRFPELALDGDALALARETLARTGMLVVGEPHGVRETPSVLYALASTLGTRAVGFEWSHEEMDPPLQEFLRTGAFDFARLWQLPPSSEFFCGDGRLTAGHFALLRRLRQEGRLDQVIAFDRLDPEPAPDDWQLRDREMAERLLALRDEGAPLLVLTGAFHARLDVAEGTTMAAHLARALPGLWPAMLDYAEGHCIANGELHDVSPPMPDAPIRLQLPKASPAVLPSA